MDLFAPSLPGETAYLLMEEAAVIFDACYPTSIGLLNVGAISRPPSFPGQQRRLWDVPQPGCINTTAIISGSGDTGGAAAAVPRMAACSAARNVELDVVAYGADIDWATSKPVPNGQILVLRDQVNVCQRLLSTECVQQLGPLGCYLATVGTGGSGGVNGSSISSSAGSGGGGESGGAGSGIVVSGGGFRPPAAALSTSGRDEDGGDDDVLIAALCASLIGGAALLALVVGAAVLLVRRRRQQLQLLRKEEPSKAPSDPLTAAELGEQPQQQEQEVKSAAAEDATTAGGGGCGRGRSGSMRAAGDCEGGTSTTATASSTHTSTQLAAVQQQLQQQQAPVTTFTPQRSDLHMNVRLVAPTPTGSHPNSQVHKSSTGGGRESGSGSGGSGRYCGRGSGSRSGDCRDQQVQSPSAAVPAGLGQDAAGAAVAQPAAAAATAAADGQGSGGDSLDGCRSSAQQRSQAAQAPEPAADGLLPGAAADPDVVQLLPVVLGRGAFGQVVEGLFRGQRVAVKLLAADCNVLLAQAQAQPGGGNTAGAERDRPADAGPRAPAKQQPQPRASTTRSFADEVAVLGRVDHPNVVRLLGACLDPPPICLVMERMETNLDCVLHGRAPAGGMPAAGAVAGGSGGSTRPLLSLRKALHIALGAARGLEYLHPTVLHRDLKPANVLLNNPDSDTPEVKITDFGISRLNHATLVTQRPGAGTPAYLAPECYEAATLRQGGITHRADMYSFGIMLWELLTGLRPWQGYNLLELAAAMVMHNQRPPLAAIDRAGGGAHCPASVRALVAQCWEHDPLRRPAAAEAVKCLEMALQELSDGVVRCPPVPVRAVPTTCGDGGPGLACDSSAAALSSREHSCSVQLRIIPTPQATQALLRAGSGPGETGLGLLSAMRTWDPDVPAVGELGAGACDGWHAGRQWQPLQHSPAHAMPQKGGITEGE
ncbi:hypothetical protein HXX76_012671 [Chlamydomonas incerta]|uniref:Protein kinase domain-containing protein n=1 Tax=Chlamydomonas incerta TaxID=51695 RepID=A0A835VVC5_CHLIN|nr:hypothetical protein HXX76_012671 [Chlamydomonas incerta]|eukprot:KAG2426884.1 hypothetical protein HXX76_012671 [Chlamydomonas incerta]